jgi:hypothetical protein
MSQRSTRSSLALAWVISPSTRLSERLMFPCGLQLCALSRLPLLVALCRIFVDGLIARHGEGGRASLFWSAV